MYKDLNNPGGIWTLDRRFWRRTRWPLCHAARADYVLIWQKMGWATFLGEFIFTDSSGHPASKQVLLANVRWSHFTSFHLGHHPKLHFGFALLLNTRAGICSVVERSLRNVLLCGRVRACIACVRASPALPAGGRACIACVWACIACVRAGVHCRRAGVACGLACQCTELSDSLYSFLYMKIFVCLIKPAT
jgi:hypothetical protein